jgi:immune inhibitor A
LINRYPLCKIPPHPSVLAEIKRELDQATKRNPSINKIDFLKSLGIEPGYNPLGRDDPARPKTEALMEGRIEMERVHLPSFKPVGDINALVVLIDFDDNVHAVAPDHYSEMLFSKDTFLTGSLRDYYQTVSNKKVNIIGQVSGWHRMPENYTFYVGNDSGGDQNGYPHNAKRMVEDGVTKVLNADRSIQWDKYDINGDGMVDALFIVHAGPGAEVKPTTAERAKHIWSHKWVTQRPVQVTNKTHIALYLTVPEDGLLGVYAHEAGHLIFGWPDLYDACPGSNRTAGVGDWSLMASGSWNNGGLTPAYPDAWCRHVQGWTKTTVVRGTKKIRARGIEDIDKVYLVQIRDSPHEFFMIESRRRVKYDQHLPGEGLLVYHIDEAAENNCDENHLAVGVIQADGQQNLQRIGLLGNQGDDGDPFPGSGKRKHLNSRGFPNSLDYSGNPTGFSIGSIGWKDTFSMATMKVTKRRK